MDRRTLPSRHAKKKAEELFIKLSEAVSEDEDLDERVKFSRKKSDDSFSEPSEKSFHSDNEIESEGKDSETELNEYILPTRQPKKPRKKTVQKNVKKRPTKTKKKTTPPSIIQFTNDDEVFIKEEPESENEHDEENNINLNDTSSRVHSFPESFAITKQALMPSDPNTAIWTTSVFTITAVLPGGDVPNNEVNSTEEVPETSGVDSLKEGNKAGFISCPICQVSFTKMKLKKHINTEHGGVDKPFVCDICNKSWKSWDRMNDHRISHSDSTTHQCDLCDKSFKRKYTLQAHVFYKHSADERVKKSMYQTKRINQRPPEPLGRNVGPYKIDQNALPPFKCPEPGCEESHDTICRLQRHYSQAHRERSWICETCGNSYPGERELHVHYRCHTDSRPYVCEKCGSTYKSRAHLNSHILRSHDEQGHEAYKAYRRETVRKLNLAKKKMKEKELTTVADTCQTSNSNMISTSSDPVSTELSSV